MNILILDDDIEWLNKIYQTLSYYALSRKEDYHFFRCMNEEEVKNILLHHEINMIVSDIEKDDGNNNIEFIKKIAEINNAIIIFVTNYDRYALQSFGLHVCRYILKSDFDNQAKNMIDFIETNYFKNKEFIIDTYEGIVSFKHREIYFIECFGHDVYLYTSKRKYKLKTITMKELQNILPDIFVLISRNTMININHIKTLDNNGVLLKNNKKLYISRRRKKEVYMKYCEKLEIGLC